MPRNNTKVNTDEIVREPELLRLTGLSRSSIYRLEKQKKFPQRVRISERAVGWIASQVQKWIGDCSNNTVPSAKEGGAK